jgi:hypothetical protein
VILPYLSRLLCLGLASLFLVNLTTALIIALFTPLAIGTAQRLAPRRAARLFLTLRLLPFGLALSTVLCLCVPSYLWFEPERIEESVGFPCLFISMLGAITCGIVVARGVRAAVSSFLFARCCQRSGFEMHFAGDDPPAVVIEGSKPLLALAGIVHPRLVISEGVVSALSEEELSIALRHERAHQISCDNLKRLCIFLAPGILPLLNGFRELERSWMSFAEYAADEAAVGGDAQRSLALASALVKVARLGRAALSPVAISFLEDVSHLSVRVDRLLAKSPSRESAHPMSWFKVGSILVLASCVAAMFFAPTTFHFVQSVLERLIQ